MIHIDMFKTLTLPLLGAALTFSTAALRAEMIEYSAGHGDIGLAFEDNSELFLHYHFGVTAVLDGKEITNENDERELAPSQAYVRVPDSVRTTIPSSPSFSFLGPAGSDAWVLPTVERAGVPYLGIAAEELDPLLFGDNATFELTSFSGPGDFSLWASDSFGNPSVRFDTQDGIIDPAFDTLSIGVGSHNHFNFGFTAPGVYQLGIVGSAQHDTLGLLSDSGVFTFAVGDVTAVPEPASMAALAVAAIGGVAAKRFRNRRKDALLAEANDESV